MAILPDHPTPLNIKTHTSDPIPFIIYDSTNEVEGVETYTENNCSQTGVFFERGKDITQTLFNAGM